MRKSKGFKTTSIVIFGVILLALAFLLPINIAEDKYEYYSSLTDCRVMEFHNIVFMMEYDGYDHDRINDTLTPEGRAEWGLIRGYLFLMDTQAELAGCSY